MRDRQTAPAVYTFHLTRNVVLVALLGVVAIMVGLFAPLSARAGDNQGGGVDPSAKPWICHPVEGAGETGHGWNLIDPSKASVHIDEATGVGKHSRKDGRTDVYAVGNGASWTCPGGPTSPTSGTTSEPTGTTSEPTETTTATEPTGTTSEPTETTTATEPTGTTGTEAPETGATEPSTTSTGPAAPAETPQEPAAVPPRTPDRTVPEVGTVEENVVPRAQTDGADLVGAGGGSAGWTVLQATLVGAGVLLLVASGLLSVRRQRAQE